MELSFHSYKKDYTITLKGKLSHTVKLGSDIHGNITRINNVIDGFGDDMALCREKLDNTKKQWNRAISELDKPFDQVDELKAKMTLLNEVNALLSMDEKDNSVLGGDSSQENKKRNISPKDLKGSIISKVLWRCRYLCPGHNVSNVVSGVIFDLLLLKACDNSVYLSGYCLEYETMSILRDWKV